MQAIQAVRSAVAKRPIVGNVIVYGMLYTGAEFIQQTANNKILVPAGSPSKPYDTGTLARYAFMGTCVFPHTLYFAYRYLDSRFVGKTLKAVLPKLAADALIVTPINLTIFYVGMSILERKKDIFEEWSKKIVPTFVARFVVPGTACYKLLVMLLNFTDSQCVLGSSISHQLPVPASQARVIYVGTCQVIWVSILCWFKRQEY